MSCFFEFQEGLGFRGYSKAPYLHLRTHLKSPQTYAHAVYVYWKLSCQGFRVPGRLLRKGQDQSPLRGSYRSLSLVALCSSPILQTKSRPQIPIPSNLSYNRNLATLKPGWWPFSLYEVRLRLWPTTEEH